MSLAIKISHGRHRPRVRPRTAVAWLASLALGVGVPSAGCGGNVRGSKECLSAAQKSTVPFDDLDSPSLRERQVPSVRPASAQGPEHEASVPSADDEPVAFHSDWSLLVYQIGGGEFGKTPTTDGSPILIPRAIHDQGLWAISLERPEELRDEDAIALRNLIRKYSIPCIEIDGSSMISDDFLRSLSQEPSLTGLVLMDCPRITDRGIGYLCEKLVLRELVIRGCAQLTDESLRLITALSELRRLTFESNNNITDTGIEHIATMSQLTSISLSELPKVSRYGPSLEKLNMIRMPNLRWIWTGGISVRPRHLIGGDEEEGGEENDAGE